MYGDTVPRVQIPPSPPPWKKVRTPFAVDSAPVEDGSSLNSSLSFFSSLKKERVKKRIYRTRDLARADIFNYIEMFYNPKRRHSHLGGVSPEAFETASFLSNELSVKLG